MPVGHIQRIDEEQQTVYVVRDGTIYTAPLSQVESKARVPSARVRFKLVRNGGSESAADVRLRTGTRTNRRHRRFGDLTGATRAGAKIETTASRNFGIDVTTQPFRVAKTWLAALSDQDFDGATSLYHPNAVLHSLDPDLPRAVGPNQIRGLLERLPSAGIEHDSIEIDGIDCYVRIGYRIGDDAHLVYLVSERGSITEQWIDVEPELPPEPADELPMELVCRGAVSDQAKRHATERLTTLIERSGRTAQSARAKLTQEDNHSFDSPAIVQMSIKFDHLLVRAHGSAPTLTEAIDLAAAKLGARIEHEHDRQRKDPVRLEPSPGLWRHGNLPRTETPFYDRPVDEREIVRHKSFAPDEMTIDEAAWDMALLDYDFFLFFETETGQDLLMERRADDSLVIRRLEGSDALPTSTVNEIEQSDAAAPVLPVSEAVKLLNATGDRLQFFTNQQTGRGNVIYRRFDGHYGLITPSHEDNRW